MASRGGRGNLGEMAQCMSPAASEAASDCRLKAQLFDLKGNALARARLRLRRSPGRDFRGSSRALAQLELGKWPGRRCRGSGRALAQIAAVLYQGRSPGSGAAQAWQLSGTALPRQRASAGSKRSCFVSRAVPWLERGSARAWQVSGKTLPRQGASAGSSAAVLSQGRSPGSSAAQAWQLPRALPRQQASAGSKRSCFVPRAMP